MADLVYKAKQFFGLTPPVDGSDYYLEEAEFEPHYRDRNEVLARRREPRTVTVDVTSYDQAAEVGEPFRDGDIVVFDVNAMPKAEAKRIVDFAAGLCFALHGDLDKVAPRVFAMVPEGVHVAPYELQDVYEGQARYGM